MRKLLGHSLLLSVLLGSSLPYIPPAYAQSTKDEIAAEASDEVDLEEEIEEEAPPPPEAPYPGSEQSPSAAPKAQAQKQNQQQKAPKPQATPLPPLVNERPLRTNDDGEYFYDTKLKDPVPNPAPGTPMPKGVNDQGEFFYDKETKKAEFSGRPGTEAPIQTNKEGEFFYPTESSPRKGTFSFRFGFLNPPDITNPDAAVTFKDIYGDGNVPLLLGDYEWQLTSKIGRFGIKLVSGLGIGSGTGRFKEVDPRRRPDDTPEEKFTFLLFPNHVTAIYRFQYADEQLFVPFVEGGAGYFTFAEIRNDDKGPKFGGAPVTVVAGGLNILLDWLDRHSVRQLDAEYGVNHVWLTGEYRFIVGLNKDFDFTSGVINAGFMMDF